MLSNLRSLEIITYRGALALSFSDSATNKAVTEGLRIQAWRYDAGTPQPARQTAWAEKSQTSAIYGFRSLPGLERYQVGDSVPPGSESYIVRIEDERGRYLPQLRRFDLPLATPAVQAIPLYPAPSHTAPVGFATLRGELLRTTAPPNLEVIDAARWARVVVSVPADDPGDPSLEYAGFADARGMFAVMVPYPLIPPSVALNDADWNVTLAVQHTPGSFTADLALIQTVLPVLAPDAQQPFHATLEAQGAAVIFEAVTVVDADAGLYTAVGSTTNTSFPYTLTFGANPPIQTPIDGSTATLSELLIRST